ncbi:MAG: response regulator [Anaerolineaceae bacterium]|nr:response regulator [Anaerolineaceae bacterium]
MVVEIPEQNLVDQQSTILVVEDDVDLLQGIEEVLRIEGYEVYIAHDGLEALDVLKNMVSPPDLIISDIMMPKMNGIQFFKTVRRDTRWLMLPFIFLTAKGEKSDQQLGFRLGVDDYVVKPYDPPDLLARIGARLTRHRLLHQYYTGMMERLKKEILTILNHEFRTPLTFVVAYADLLKSSDLSELRSEEIITYIKGISSGADRLRRLIENFITLVELQTDEAYKTFVWRKAPVESLEAVVQAAWKHNNLFEETTHQLIVETMKNIPTFIGDEIYLRVAVAQLLSNAVKFSPSHYPITVGAVVEGNYVRLWVKDRGRGIPTRELARIWESFYQVDRAEYEDAGAGAGLAIVAGILRLHGGDVEVVSAVGEGSIFSLIIPLAGLDALEM